MKHILVMLTSILMINLTYGEEIVLDTDLGPLVGTLELPESRNIDAIVLLIAGSGPTNRDGNINGLPGNNNSLKYLAQGLAQKNIASLRYDKRLIGDSATVKLKERDIRFDHYVADARLWIEYLDHRFSQPIYVAGHSEGALVAMIAAKGKTIAGVVSIAGVGRPAAQLLLEQLQAQLPPSLMQEAERIVASLEIGKTTQSPPELNAIFRPSVQPYLISWFRFDPAEEIASSQVPVLIVQGTNDIQVPKINAELLSAAKPSAQLTLIDGMNHVLKTVSGNERAQVRSYSDPSLPISAELVSAITGFVTP